MGKFKINRQQLPVKAHFFFFMAAMGPILPFLPVYGKQLGVSAVVMGSITAVLPIAFLIAKPAFGFLVDNFRAWRRIIFMGLLAATSACFVLMYLLPGLHPGPAIADDKSYNWTARELPGCSDMKMNVTDNCSSGVRLGFCTWSCPACVDNFTAGVYFHSTKVAQLTPETSCLVDVHSKSRCIELGPCQVSCKDTAQEDHCVYKTITFWGFVLLMSLGNIGFNVSNCISDAICFDVLGEGKQMSYGRQRVWGSIGFGITALMAGYAMDLWSNNETVKSYTPAFLLVAGFTLVDLLFCFKLQLPNLSATNSILKEVYELIKIKEIAIFLCFATVAGILDSFIIYFLFWYLEDLAKATGYMHEIKLIEGLTIFAETVGGEVLFFSLSGKILKKIGYGYSFVFCFVCYALRLGLISLASTPRWVVLIEFFMQGPTYALCYTTIVAYASAISPPGTSATVQGVVAGMDDGLGFAIGSLIGGILYKEFGGVTTMRLYSLLAVVTSVTYFVVHLIYLKHVMPEIDSKEKVEWKNPDDAAKACEDANDQ